MNTNRLALDLLKAMQADMQNYLLPDSEISCHKFASQMIRHLDGPQQRAAQAALEAVQVEPSKDVILEALHEYHCSESIDEDGDGLPLVDVLTHGGDIGPGVREVEALADFIWGALTDAAPQEPAVNAELLDALWVCMEHNRLHFGESHNTVIQSRAAIAKAT